LAACRCPEFGWFLRENVLDGKRWLGATVAPGSMIAIAIGIEAAIGHIHLQVDGMRRVNLTIQFQLNAAPSEVCWIEGLSPMVIRIQPNGS